MPLSQRGQAAVEYLFVLVFMLYLSTKIVNRFGVFFRDSVGNLSHVLSTHLTVGVCPRHCFFAAYKNRHQP